MEVHHIFKIHVCICLSYFTIKEIRVTIWYVFENICQGLRKNPKIMKKIVKVAERDTNNSKYRLFPFCLICPVKVNQLYCITEFVSPITSSSLDQIEPNKNQKMHKKFRILLT